MPKTSTTFTERFWKKVNQLAPNECWPWLAAINNTGYGIINRNGKPVLAHRIAYEIASGHTLLADHVVCHSCDNRWCVNPAHLWIGSVSDNNEDRHKKGRSRGGALTGETNPRAKLSAQTALEISKATGSLADVAAKFKTSPEQVSAIRRGRAWSSVTGIPRIPFRMGGLGPIEYQVLLYLRETCAIHNQVSDTEIAADLGFESRFTVAHAKQRLAKLGHIRKIGRGRWELLACQS